MIVQRVLRRQRKKNVGNISMSDFLYTSKVNESMI